MDTFKDQLYQFIPLTTNLLIKLDNELNLIDEEIKICRQRIEKKNELMKDVKIKHFLESNSNSYKEISFNLSKFISSIKQIDYEFRKFENESLEFKLKNYDLIKQQINEYNEMNYWSTVGIPDLLGMIKESFDLDEERNKLISIRKVDLDVNIPLEEQKLDKLKEQFNCLNENFKNINQFLYGKQDLLSYEEGQLEDKQKEFDYHSKCNEEKKMKKNEENLKLVHLKSAIRKCIFEYLNKIKKLDDLTKTKNAKIDEFRNLVKKYSKESVNDLNEKRSRLENEICELDKQLDLHPPSDSSNKENNDFLKKFKTKKSKNKQLKVSLVENLNSLEDSYQKLIDKYDEQINLTD